LRSAVGKPTDQRDRDLRQFKLVATGLLFCAALICIAAVLLTPRYPLFAYLAATCESAIVGGLADWFAVVALFRRPLKLPLPHTAIIPRNKERIAQSLGNFIQEQFLTTPALVSKIKEVNPAGKLAAWLRAPANSIAVANYAIRLLSHALAALDDRRVRDFLRNTMSAKLQELDVAGLTAVFWIC
jgi:uncharacterized membrane-anchored protein YjiN (DUF445 family)